MEGRGARRDEVVFIVFGLFGSSLSVHGSATPFPSATTLLPRFTVGDVDGDGTDDLVGLTSGLPIGPVLLEVHRSTGSTFVPVAQPAPLQLDGLPIALTVADVDTDGAADLLTVDRDHDKLVWWNGSGDGTMREIGTSFRVEKSAGDSVADLTLLDLDGDARPEVLAAMDERPNAEVRAFENRSWRPGDP